jgi:hypothetical protein
MNEIQECFNVERESRSGLAAVVFQKSTALSYPLAVKIAKAADKYYESLIGKRLIHCAIFNKTPENASLAVSLIECVGNLQGVQVWVLGEIVLNPFNVSETLKCYYTSLLCDDPKAHCVVYHKDSDRDWDSVMKIGISLAGVKYQEPRHLNIRQYLIPCRRIDNPYGPSGLCPFHPSSLEDQVQAMAVTKGCNWCPHFDKHNLKVL